MCAICSKRCKTRGNMRAHEQTHTPRPKETCAVCNKKYQNNNSLTQHQRKMHTREDVTCLICGMVNKTKELEDQHRLTCHREHYGNCHGCGVELYELANLPPTRPNCVVTLPFCGNEGCMFCMQCAIREDQIDFPLSQSAKKNLHAKAVEAASETSKYFAFSEGVLNPLQIFIVRLLTVRNLKKFRF